MSIRCLGLWLCMFLCVSSVSADAYLRDQGAVSALLKGTTLQGIYLRTQSAYSLQFNQDGSLLNQKGEQGKWWVNEQGQYCREWLTGRMKGHQACLDIAQEGDQLAIYSNDKKVAIGALVRKQP